MTTVIIAISRAIFSSDRFYRYGKQYGISQKNDRHHFFRAWWSFRRLGESSIFEEKKKWPKPIRWSTPFVTIVVMNVRPPHIKKMTDNFAVKAAKACTPYFQGPVCAVIIITTTTREQPGHVWTSVLIT
ncbi:hypothetical protein HDC91_002959 [Mucilaginibacter sp. AK015]|nr:hypothetical protein [Mucilaginibacter sp. AK015]